MFTLAIRANKLITRPHIAMIKENNVRTSFFTDDQIAAVLADLPEAIRAGCPVCLSDWLAHRE